MCEETRARRWRARRLPGCCQDCCNGDRDAVFIYPPPSCHCCVCSEFAELGALGTLGELSNPQTLPTMQNVIGQHTPCALFMENKG